MLANTATCKCMGRNDVQWNISRSSTWRNNRMETSTKTGRYQKMTLQITEYMGGSYSSFTFKKTNKNLYKIKLKIYV
jgi:hypothetical protein